MSAGSGNLPTILGVTPTEVRAEFPADASSAGQARRFVGATLRTWSCDRLLDVATLLVSELVANSVLHAGTAIRVVVRRTDTRLRVEVHDDSARLPIRKHYSALSATGRGLMLVERMADDWGVLSGDGGGKAVWFELDSSGTARPPAYEAFHLEDFALDELDDLGGEGVRADRGGPTRGGRGLDTGPRALVVGGRR